MRNFLSRSHLRNSSYLKSESAIALIIIRNNLLIHFKHSRKIAKFVEEMNLSLALVCCLNILAFAAWPVNFEETFEVMQGVIDVSGVPAYDGGIVIVANRFGELIAERISPEGELRWNANGSGIFVFNSENRRFLCSYYKLLQDDDNGIYILYDRSDTWVEDPFSPPLGNIFIQHIDSEGNRTWGENGIPIDTIHHRLNDVLDIIRYNENNLAMFWTIFSETENEYINTYGQIITIEGEISWDENGKLVHIDPASNCINDDGRGFFLMSSSWILNRYSTTQYIDSEGNKIWDSSGVSLDFWSMKSSKISDNRVLFCGYRDRNHTILANIIDNDGSLLWGEELQVTDSPYWNRQMYIQAFTDDEICIIWNDTIAGDLSTIKAKAQLVNINGDRLWGLHGIELFPNKDISMHCASGLFDQQQNLIVSGGYLFALTVLSDSSVENRGNYRLQGIQKIDNNGNLLFGEYGIEFNPPFEQVNNFSSVLMLDGLGGLVFGSFNYETLYLWRMRSDGTLGAGTVKIFNDKAYITPCDIEFTLYPNPTNSHLNVLFSGLLMPTHWQIFNPLGCQVQMLQIILIPGKTQIGLSIEDLTAGTYLFTAYNGEKSITKPITIIK